MNNTISHSDGFLLNICARPDDDFLRLIYADYLEERGEAAWAEFIRLQIELSEHLAGASPCASVKCDSLKKREQELFHANHQRWLKPWGNMPFFWKFERGLVAEVHCHVLDWSHVHCASCNGRGWVDDHYRPIRGPVLETVYFKCGDCGAVGHQGAGHGDKIITKMPITKLYVTNSNAIGANPLSGYWLDMRLLNDTRTKADLPLLLTETDLSLRINLHLAPKALTGAAS